MKRLLPPPASVVGCLLFILFTVYSVVSMAELPGATKRAKNSKHKVVYGKKNVRKTVSKSSLARQLSTFNTCPNPASPAKPNGGEVVICNANEQVALLSSPALPNSGPCYFHCGLLWSAPSGWGIIFDPNGPGYSMSNPIYGTFGITTAMAIKAPGSVSPGNAGTVNLLAEYSQCSAPYNTSSSAILWVGATGVSNGKVNGSPSSVPTYVPSGYASLNVDLTGGSDGGNTSWYVTHGSASLSPSYNYCTATWSGFTHVVVDAGNRCGAGGSWTFYLTTQQGYYGYRVAPNPAKDKLSILLDYPQMIGEIIQNVTLYDADHKAWFSSDASQLKSVAGDKNVIDIATRTFPRGTYFLHVTYGMKGSGRDEILKSQVILE